MDEPLMKATITVEGTPAQLAKLFGQLHRLALVQYESGPGQAGLLIDWNAHPAFERLRDVEREIIRLDLLNEPRRRIATQLELGANTVTVYRRTIRSKLRGAPAEQYPAAIQHWLRRFPGQVGVAPPRPAHPEQPPE